MGNSQSIRLFFILVILKATRVCTKEKKAGSQIKFAIVNDKIPRGIRIININDKKDSRQAHQLIS